MHPKKSWIVFISTYPPRECGIATFTEDLTNSFNELFAPAVESKVVAMNLDDVNRHNYPKRVIGHLSQNSKAQYAQIADMLNRSEQVRLVNIQHEFGIFGGQEGSYLLELTSRLTKPYVITFHTVLPTPNPKLKEVVIALASRAAGIIVMTESSKKILMSEYSIAEELMTIVPHGIHPMNFSPTEPAKETLQLNGTTILSTFGLLSASKGVEYVIEALPPVVKRYPQLRFLIIGATHPVVLKKEGESYRNALIKLVRQLGLSDHVKFYNEYVGKESLLKFLQATDIYLSTPLNPNQAVSGTLSYALGAGRPVIATEFGQAKEVVTKDVGALVPFRNPGAITKALLAMLEDKKKRFLMGKRAYFKTREATWPNVALAYMRLFAKIAPTLKTDEKHLPKIKLSFILKLTDSFGMLQFSKLVEPDPESGYTVDDNARALIAVCRYYEHFRSPLALRLAHIYLTFLKTALQKDGYFHNYINYDRTLHAERNSTESMEDPTSRALFALSVVANQKNLPRKMRHLAGDIFNESMNANPKFTQFLRSRAFLIKAYATWLLRYRDPRLEKEIRRNCDLLVRAYHKNASDNWQWFEPELTYANGVLPEALMMGYLITKEPTYKDIAKKTLDFLISHTFIGNMYMPIGQRGWFKKDSDRALFDQQPEEATSIIETLSTAFALFKEKEYQRLTFQAFNWFLGDNILGRIMYDQTSGGCYDGIGEKEINLNQGAESTVSYLIARLAVQNRK